MRILLAEDDALVSMVVVDALDDSGCEVIAVPDAASAIDVLNQKRIDILITDIRMPGSMTGWDVAEEARKHQPTIPVIYMTGDSQREMAFKGVPGGHLLSKPFSIDKLGALVNKLGQSANAFYVRLRFSGGTRLVGNAESIQAAVKEGYDRALEHSECERGSCAIEVLDQGMQFVFGMPVRLLERPANS